MTDTASLIALDPQTAARLIYSQFPELAGEAIAPLAAKGTDNHIFRVGNELCARFPKVSGAAGTARREAAALPRFLGAPLSVPKVYAMGAPGEGYPLVWSILEWLPGTPLEDSGLTDPFAAAGQVGEFIGFLRDVPVSDGFHPGACNNGRGAPLQTRTPAFEVALARLPQVDPAWANRLWSEALRADEASAPVWLHGDIHPGNILVSDGLISGIIDWGLCGVGDGACDLLTAWAVFDSAPREVFRKSASAADAEWMRGAGWALSMAVIYLPYAYENGLRSDMSEKMIARLGEEFA